MQLEYTSSLWDEVELPTFGRLKTELETDVCIIGGGIAGLSSAYYLKDLPFEITILDDGNIGGRQTMRTTAHLSNAIDDRYYRIQKIYGHKKAELVYESYTAAIKMIDEIVQKESIDCDFRYLDGYLFLDKDHDLSDLKEEFKASKKSGFKNLGCIKNFLHKDFSLGPCLKFPRQGTLHAGKYVEGLIKTLQKYNIKMFSQTRVEDIKEEKGKNYIKTSSGRIIQAKHVIVATNTPMNTRFQIHVKQAAYRSYVIGCPIHENDFPDVLLWDMGDPYHYIRKVMSQQGPVLLIGGSDHKTGQMKSDPFKELERWAFLKFPFLERVSYRWSGQIMEPADYLGFIGKFKDNTYIITGDSGHGITQGTLGGKIISDLIQENKNPFEKLYDPHRLHFSKDFFKENVNTNLQYKDYFSDGDLDSESKIKLREGAVIKQGVNMRALYKDEEGNVHAMSAVCPHLGGIVHWNNVEKTWDCPCHGSRFSKEGKLICGPAYCDLEKVYEDELQDVA